MEGDKTSKSKVKCDNWLEKIRAKGERMRRWWEEVTILDRVSSSLEA